jgi:hypothetical protein
MAGSYYPVAIESNGNGPSLPGVVRLKNVRLFLQANARKITRTCREPGIDEGPVIAVRSPIGRASQ